MRNWLQHGGILVGKGFPQGPFFDVADPEARSNSWRLIYIYIILINLSIYLVLTFLLCLSPIRLSTYLDDSSADVLVLLPTLLCKLTPGKGDGRRGLLAAAARVLADPSSRM